MAACLALASCIGQRPPPMGAAIFCAKGAECDGDWARAAKWITDNSAYDIASTTDTLIQTAGPEKNSPIPALTVSRKDVGHGLMRIDMDAHCDAVFQCDPSQEDLRAAFTRAVTPLQTASWPEPSASLRGGS
jgi:hypothetical protein